MNDHGVYEYVLNEKIFLGVVGILECEFPYDQVLTPH